MSTAAGLLSLVGTPIGNLEDITLRALRVLRAADVIAAEDTRRTGVLLARHQIRRPLLSCHEFNEAKRSAELVERLQAGSQVALVTDAGMPTLSDPGQRLLRAALAAGVKVEIVPGPSAITAALAGSGFGGGGYLFHGFLPYKSGARRKVLAGLAALPYPIVFFESPYRLAATLADIEAVFGNRAVVVGRELTKKFEEFLRGDLAALRKMLEARTVKGEITLVVEGYRQE